MIEPLGRGEYCDDYTLKANKKVYYDRLFKQIGLRTIKEGRFIWNDYDQEFEHFESNENENRKIWYNRTYYWIVS